MSIELNKENSVDLLKRYLDAGYKSTGIVSIKEGAAIHRYFRILKKQEELKEEEKGKVTDKEIYQVLFKVLDAFNAGKAYSLDDAAVIDKVVTFIEGTFVNEKQKEKIVEV